MGDARPVERSPVQHGTGEAAASRPRRANAPLPSLLGLQRVAGNRAVAGLIAGRAPTVQRAGTDLAALDNRAREQIAAAQHKGGPHEAGAAPQEPPNPQVVAAEKAKQRAALAGVVEPVDTSQARSEAAGAAKAVQAEASKPPEPVTGGAGPAAGNQETAGGAEPDGGAAQEAAARAESAAAEADAVPVPEPAEPVAVPAVPEVVDGGGRRVPAAPALQGMVAGVTARIQVLRAGAHEIRVAAAGERAHGHRLDGMLHAGLNRVADAADGIAALEAHTAHRRGVAAQARKALEVSKQKADAVATGAPQVRAKGDEGSAKSGPMAAESADLARRNAAQAPEDSEAAGKSAEQGAKLNQASGQLATIDATITQTRERADALAAEAAHAKESNAATEGRLAETEQAIAQVEAKSGQVNAQNAAARARLTGMAAKAAEHRQAADQLDSQGRAAHDASVQLEARLRASEERYVGAMSAMPPPVPARTGAAVQRSAYEGRTTFDPAGAVNSDLPSWLTGEDRPNVALAARHRAEAEARRSAETAEIEREAGGHFERLSTSRKMGIALTLAGRNVLRELGDTDLPRFGLTLLRGFVDPRVSLMGVVHGVGQIASGVANLFSAQQWQRDPLGNALKSSADLATGVTIVLGSIAGLAVAIGVLLTAAAIVGSIFSFGAVGLALAPIIAFCGTVATTVGPWALWAAGLALGLHAMVFIKNLIDAAAAQTAAGLQASSERMTEDAKNAGAMALQIGMAKAMEAIGARLGRGRVGPGEPPGAGAAGEVPTGTAAGEVAPPAELPAGTAANDNAVPFGESPLDLPRGPAANDNMIPASEPVSMPEPVKMTADGTLPTTGGPRQPNLRSLPGGAAEAPGGLAPEGPVASGGEGGRTGTVAEPGQVSTTEGPGSTATETSGPRTTPETTPKVGPESATAEPTPRAAAEPSPEARRFTERQGAETLEQYRDRLQGEADRLFAAEESTDQTSADWDHIQGRLSEAEARVAAQERIATEEAGNVAEQRAANELWEGERLRGGRRVTGPELDRMSVEELNELRQEIQDRHASSPNRKALLTDLDNRLSKADHAARRQAAQAEARGSRNLTDEAVLGRIRTGTKDVWASSLEQAQRIANQLENEIRQQGGTFSQTTTSEGQRFPVHGPESHAGANPAPADPHINVEGEIVGANGTPRHVKVHIYFPAPSSR